MKNYNTMLEFELLHALLGVIPRKGCEQHEVGGHNHISHRSIHRRITISSEFPLMDLSNKPYPKRWERNHAVNIAGNQNMTMFSIATSNASLGHRVA